MTIVIVSWLFIALLINNAADISTKIIKAIILWKVVNPTNPPPRRIKIKIPIIQNVVFISKCQFIQTLKAANNIRNVKF